jgi:hypothetical protein
VKIGRSFETSAKNDGFQLDSIRNFCQRRIGLVSKSKKGAIEMSLKKSAMAAIAAVSLVAVPAVAQAAQSQSAVSKLSVRAAPAQRDANKMGGNVGIIALALALIVLGVVAASSGGSSNPTSP